MNTEFNKATYLSQVRRLRNLAQVALSDYPLKPKNIHFIHHGENTTFRVECGGGENYLLRIHRNDYHTKAAIQEELAWLSHLRGVGLSVPQPIAAEHGQFVSSAFHTDVGVTRNCSVFRWIDGKFIEKSLRPKHLFMVGQIIGDLQNFSKHSRAKHRHYWSADGLLGQKAKFGSIDSLAQIALKQQKLISTARKIVLRKLKAFEARHPKRMGLIHADLHFGNILSTGQSLGAIDFDDCGYGFHAYDLVIPLLSVQGLLGEKEKQKVPKFKEALINGYCTKRSWDKEDEAIYPYLMTARKLLMLGWLNSRSDNPRLCKHLKGAVDRATKHLKSEYDF